LCEKGEGLGKRGHWLKGLSVFPRVRVQDSRISTHATLSAKLLLNIYRHLFQNGLCELLFAFNGAKVLAGLITLHYNKNAIYAYSASVKESVAPSKHPNEALFWHAIQAIEAADMDAVCLTLALHHCSIRAYCSSKGNGQQKPKICFICAPVRKTGLGYKL
jgi:hypothetical protein